MWCKESKFRKPHVSSPLKVTASSTRAEFEREPPPSSSKWWMWLVEEHMTHRQPPAPYKGTPRARFSAECQSVRYCWITHACVQDGNWNRWICTKWAAALKESETPPAANTNSLLLFHVEACNLLPNGKKKAAESWTTCKQFIPSAHTTLTTLFFHSLVFCYLCSVSLLLFIVITVGLQYSENMVRLCVHRNNSIKPLWKSLLV